MNAPLVLMVSLITCMVTVNRCILCGKCGVTASIEGRHSDIVCGKGGVTASIEDRHSDTVCGKGGVTASIEGRHSDTVCGKDGVTASIEGSHSDTVFEITTDMVLQTASVAQCPHNQVHV